MNNMNKINLLDPLLSSRIAAGEVVERPASILREFLDNSIDAGSSNITVSIENGGIDKIEVKDNGDGISREDLSVIAMRHATSKIKNPNDLYTINTLGFRGEALYSISAVSKLTINTRDRESGNASSLVIDNGKRYPVTPSSLDEGTTITSEDLFLDIPARREFLKRASTEAGYCKAQFISKALAYPSVAFRFRVDGALVLSLPEVKTLKERVMTLYREYNIAQADVLYLEKEEEDYSVKIVAGNSGVKRNDRKEIRIYVNGRQVDEYSLQQAVIYGYGDLLPGGSFPYAVVYIKDKAELVDFNIHPAKKEVKIRNISDIHHTISSLLKEGIERVIPELGVQEEFSFREAAPSYSYTPPKREDETLRERFNIYPNKNPDWLKNAKEDLKPRVKEEIKEVVNEEPIKYIGQAFNLFLICQKGDELYLIDQHAAHERILYDEIIEQKHIQRLLVPIKIQTEKDEDQIIFNNEHVYTKLGIALAHTGDGEWEISALPSIAKGKENEIASFIKSNNRDEENTESELFAIIACHRAVKKGDSLDNYAARAIIEKVFQMNEPCCPHGRTFLIKVKEETLMKMVGRT